MSYAAMTPQRELYDRVKNASRKLSMESLKIGDDEASVIAEALEMNTTLSQLNLRDNQIGFAGAQEIARTLNQTRLTQLDLSKNKIGCAGAKGIALALKSNTTLTQLNLFNNEVGDGGAQAIAEGLKCNKTLTQLNLRTNNIVGIVGAQAIAKVLQTNKTLTQLILCTNAFGDRGAQEIAAALAANSTLTELDLARTWIGDPGACAIATALNRNTALTRLDLHNTGIGDDGAQAIAAALTVNTTLTQLNLSSTKRVENKIGHVGAQAIAEALKANAALIQLDLGGNRVGDAGAQAIVEALQVKATLTKLILSDNQVGDAGALSISKALQKNTTLQNLSLSSNQIGDAGALSISEALQKNTTLQILILEKNQIGYVEETVLRHSIRPTFQLYIDKQRRPGSVRCQEVRVVVLGDPSVGKTSLVTGSADGYVRQAFSNMFSIASSTDGIDISTVVLREKDESMNLIIWDFAGQEVYLVSHQFFLRERTVYLVLFDVREDLSLNSRLAFWLRSLHACVPNADIILVGTHIDDPSYTSERQQEQKQNLANLLSSLKKSSVSFNVRSTVYINARNSTGAPSMLELKTALFQAGQKMPFYTQPVDSRYIRFRDSLRSQADQLTAENKPPLCRWHEIVKLGQSQSLSGRAIDAFMELLRFQGWVVFHSLPDTSNVPAVQPATLLASLDDIVILNPQWFTKTVLTGVITQKPKDRWVKDGIVTRKDLLRNAWKGIDSAICDQFVLLLQRYELLYKIDGDQPGTDSASSAGTRYVIPSYLPAYEFDPSRWSSNPAAGEHEVAIVMETKFLLEGFFSRLIVRFHERKFNLMAWKDAVLVNYGGPRALLRVHRNASNVRLEFTARGKHPDRLLLTLIEILDKLSSDWYPGISWKTYLRCPMQVPHDKPCLWTLRPQVRDAVINNEQPLSCSHTHITFPTEEWLPVLHSLLQRRLKAVSQPTPEDVEALQELEPQPAPASEIRNSVTEPASPVTPPVPSEQQALQATASQPTIEGQPLRDFANATEQQLRDAQAAAIQSIQQATTTQEVAEESILAVCQVEAQVASAGVQHLQDHAAEASQRLEQAAIAGEQRMQEVVAESIHSVRQVETQVTSAGVQQLQDHATRASQALQQATVAGEQVIQEVSEESIHSIRQVEAQATQGLEQMAAAGVQSVRDVASQSVQDLQRFHQALDSIIGSIPNAVKTDPVEFERLIQSTVMKRIDELAKVLDSRFDSAESLQQEQRNEIARFFNSQIQMQLDLLDKSCPWLFEVVPPTKTWYSKLTKCYTKSHTAHLLCAHITTDNLRAWHRMSDHPGYVIEDLPRWLRDYGSRVRSLLRLVRPFLKLASLAPSAPDLTGATDFAIAALDDPLNGLPYLEKLLKKADQKKGSSAKGKQPAAASAASSESTHSSQAAAREWAAFLSQTDEYKSFAGLERAVVLSTGEVRWVCPKHAQDPIYCTSSFSSSSFAGNAPSSSSSINVASSSSAAFSISSNSNSNAPSSSSAGTSSNTPSIAAPGNGTGNSSVGNAASSSSNVNVASSSSAPSASTP